MDEQTTQATTSTWDDAADGAAYEGYDDDTSSAPVEPEPNTETELPPEADELPPDGVRVQDGEVKFGDEFFGEISGTPSKETANPETANWYTPDELKATPYEQWDTERLHGDVKDFVPIVREQLKQRQAQARMQAVQNAPVPDFLTEPKQYTPKELSDAARKLACERLGLANAEDFDEYEGEHQAAQQMAMYELIQKNMKASQDYERGKTGWQELQRFNAELEARPDFNEFNEWYIRKLQGMGVTPEQVNMELYNRAVHNGNSFGLIPQVVSGWYKQYQSERAGRNTPLVSSPSPQRTRAKPPATLEGTGGAGYDTKRKLDFSKFGDLDEDAQALALMDMGIV